MHLIQRKKFKKLIIPYGKRLKHNRVIDTQSFWIFYKNYLEEKKHIKKSKAGERKIRKTNNLGLKHIFEVYKINWSVCKLKRLFSNGWKIWKMVSEIR